MTYLGLTPDGYALYESRLYTVYVNVTRLKCLYVITSLVITNWLGYESQLLANENGRCAFYAVYVAVVHLPPPPTPFSHCFAPETPITARLLTSPSPYRHL
jgi:hypothetical protein